MDKKNPKYLWHGIISALSVNNMAEKTQELTEPEHIDFTYYGHLAENTILFLRTKKSILIVFKETGVTKNQDWHIPCSHKDSPKK